MNNRNGEAEALMLLAITTHDLGESDRAMRLGEQALAIAHDIGNERFIAFVSSGIGWLAYLRGDYHQAKRLFVWVARYPPNETTRAANFTNIGHTCAALGEKSESQRYYLKGLNLARQLDQVALQLEVVAGLARHVAAYGELEYAIALLSLAIYHPASRNNPKSIAEPLITELEVELSPEVFSAALEKGKTLDLETVLDDLLEHPGIVVPPEEPPLP